MEVILIDEVHNLGNPGDVVKVKNGYARNYLLPKKLAVSKTKYALKKIKSKKEEFEKIIIQKKGEYNALVEKLKEIKEINFDLKASKEGKLYGSVTPVIISDFLLENYDLKVDKKFIIIREQIKIVGEYILDVIFKSDIKTELKVVIKPSDN